MGATEDAGVIADELEAELRRLGFWQDEPPTEDEVLAGGAFGMGSVAFEQWIQVILVARLRQVASGEMPVPPSSNLAAHAVHEWDGADDRDSLLDLLYRVDALSGSEGA